MENRLEPYALPRVFAAWKGGGSQDWLPHCGYCLAAAGGRGVLEGGTMFFRRM